jgi:hypothetical protein
MDVGIRIQRLPQLILEMRPHPRPVRFPVLWPARIWSPSIPRVCGWARKDLNLGPMDYEIGSLFIRHCLVLLLNLSDAGSEICDCSGILSSPPDLCSLVTVASQGRLVSAGIPLTVTATFREAVPAQPVDATPPATRGPSRRGAISTDIPFYRMGLSVGGYCFSPRVTSCRGWQSA